MSLSAKALTTLDNVKSVLGINTSTEDTYLERLIEAASAYVEGQTGRQWLGAYATDIVEYPDPIGRFLFLKALPIKSITSIVENGAALAYTDDSNGEYRYDRLKDEGTVQRVNGAWSTGVRQVVVTYKGGYENQAALPADLVIAVDSLVAQMYKTAQRIGITSETMGAYSVTYQTADKASQAIPGFLESINRYRNVNIG